MATVNCDCGGETAAMDGDNKWCYPCAYRLGLTVYAPTPGGEGRVLLMTLFAGSEWGEYGVPSNFYVPTVQGEGFGMVPLMPIEGTDHFEVLAAIETICAKRGDYLHYAWELAGVADGAWWFSSYRKHR